MATRQAVRWEKLVGGCLKANTDTAVRVNKMGLGVVVRDDCGRVVLTIAEERSSGYLSISATEL